MSQILDTIELLQHITFENTHYGPHPHVWKLGNCSTFSMFVLIHFFLTNSANMAELV